jgi:hypothetical protein
MAEQKSEMQVCYARYFVGAHRIEAELFAQPDGMDVRYQMTLIQESERVTCDLGTCQNAAKQLFLRVVYGGVSACTLQDVVEDYMGTIF